MSNGMQQIRHPGGSPALILPDAASIAGLSMAAVLEPHRDEHEHLTDRRQAAVRELAGMDAALLAAHKAGVQAAAEAVRQKLPDPGQAAVEALKARQLELKREIEITTVALSDLRREALADIAAHRDEWLLEVDAAIASDRQLARETLHSYVVARGRMAERQGVRRWVVDPVRAPKVVLGHAPLATSAMGESYSLSVVLNALETELEEPAARLPGVWRDAASAPRIELGADGAMRRPARGPRPHPVESHMVDLPPVQSDSTGAPWAPGVVPFNR